MYFLTKHSTANNSLLKIITAVLFISLPFLGFYLGVNYQKNSQIQQTIETPLKPVVKKPVPTTPVVQATIDTSNWKTFTFSDNSFSFKYPSSWFVENPKDGIGAYINFFDQNSKPVHSGTESFGNEKLRIMLYDVAEFKNLTYPNLSNRVEFMVNGKKAAKDSNSIDILVKKIDNSHDLILHMESHPELDKEIQTIIPQILSTVSFLN